MLTLKLIQENKEFVIERLAVKNKNVAETVEKIIEFDNQRRTFQNQSDAPARADYSRQRAWSFRPEAIL